MKLRPVRRSWKTRVGTQPPASERLCGSTIPCGADAITSLAVEPFCRASTKRPSTVSVCVTFGADGSWTSTSVSVVRAP